MRKVAIAPELAVRKVTEALRGFLYYLSRMYFVQFIFSIIQFAAKIFVVRNRAAKNATAVLDDLSRRFNGQFDDATYKKIIKSHSIYNGIVNDAFTGLHGRRTNKLEQERDIYYFIAVALFDNFFDEHTHSPETINTMTFLPDAYSPTTFEESMFVYVNKRLLDCVKDKDNYLITLRKEYKAQAASLEQFNPDISNERIQEITFEKGGNSVLLCRYYLDIDSSNAELAAWYHLGTLIQLTNDLFDIYKDIQAGVHTLATRCSNAYAMEIFFVDRVTEMRNIIRSIPAQAKNKRSFCISMAGCYAFGLVAIEQLKKLQGDNPELPQFTNLPRKALIVDMEQLGNMWRWLRFVYKYGKL